jgi:hypothetical protein
MQGHHGIDSEIRNILVAMTRDLYNSLCFSTAPFMMIRKSGPTLTHLPLMGNPIQCSTSPTFGSISLTRALAHSSRLGLSIPRTAVAVKSVKTYQATPILLSPFNEPRLRARPCDLLRIRTKPVTGPSSPSFSMLKFARASSPNEC